MINQNMACSVDPVIFSIIDSNLCILLLKRESNDEYNGFWCLPGGLIKPEIDNDIESAVCRVLKEKTDIDVNYFEQLESLGGFRDPRMWTLTISYIALVDSAKIGLNKKNIKFFNVNELDNIKIGFDHNKIIDKGIQRLKNKVNYSNLPLYLLDDEFTLPDLQKVYEQILEQKLDKSSFRKKLFELEMVEEVTPKKYSYNGACRPSILYKKTQDKVLSFNSNIKKVKF